MSYFHVKVSFSRQQDNGLVKKETEQYLVDAMSFTETEARVIKEVGETVRELTMEAISRSPIQEVVSCGDTDLWFKCKVTYKIMDESTEKEKKNILYLLVNAKDVNEAYDRCQDHLKGMLVPFEIPKVEETQICNIYQYEKPVPAGYKPTKDNSAEVWAALPEKTKEAILFAIDNIYYDPERSGERTAILAIEAAAPRFGFDPKVYEDLVAYVERVVMTSIGEWTKTKPGR